MSIDRWIRPPFLIAVTVASLAACTTIGSNSTLSLQERLQQEGLQQGEPVKHVPFGIAGWRYLDARHVLIDNSSGQNYLIETSINCEELAFASQLGYTTTAGTLTPFDRLRARSSTGWPIDCGIQSIYLLHNSQRPNHP